VGIVCLWSAVVFGVFWCFRESLELEAGLVECEVVFTVLYVVDCRFIGIYLFILSKDSATIAVFLPVWNCFDDIMRLLNLG
jgi:hypothetical protein